MGSDIIVSAGAIGSPQLLLLSGIGPRNELNQHNISVVLRNEHVGKWMSSNAMEFIWFFLKKTALPVKKSCTKWNLERKKKKFYTATAALNFTEVWNGESTFINAYYFQLKK
jgi:choline dehydrogenase-like flavoprotein